ncbi:hypothetical protein ACIQBJ_15795 [Kitasatospora sp. NPDC088391]|uniref:hypothetical protein n=1 Tax=Kitasatospora sp. NPDC088391 TaxID=3364074 RepID=UPI0037F21E81
MTGSAEGPERLQDGRAVLQALERALGRRFSEKTPPWADLGSPVIDRGAHAIFPLAVARLPEDGAGAGAGPRGLSDVELALRRDFVHFHGGGGIHRELDLDPEEGYGRGLVDAGALVDGPPWYCLWSVERFAAVLARSADRRGGWETLALHVMPLDWVRYRPVSPGTAREASRHRRIVRARDAADAAWSWPLPGPAG